MYRCKTVETLLGSSMILPNTPRKLCDSVENPLTKGDDIHMARRKRVEEPISPPLIPERTPEGREQQLEALAMDLVERRLREGTASSAETVHFLKQASSRNQLEMEKMRYENRKIEAQTHAINSLEDQTKLFQEAVKAMQGYIMPSGEEEVEE
jgi:hypothetical protein